MERWLCILLLAGLAAGSTLVKRGEPPKSGSTKTLELEMPGSEPKGHDSYLCVAFKWQELVNGNGSEKIYIRSFDPLHAKSETAHHLMLHTCTNPPEETGKIYDCR